MKILVGQECKILGFAHFSHWSKGGSRGDEGNNLIGKKAKLIKVSRNDYFSGIDLHRDVRLEIVDLDRSVTPLAYDEQKTGGFGSVGFSGVHLKLWIPDTFVSVLLPDVTSDIPKTCPNDGCNSEPIRWIHLVKKCTTCGTIYG